MNGHRLFLEQLSTIDRVISSIARRHHLLPDERDEFRSYVRLHLLEDDARSLRSFEGRSSWPTFLNVVVSRLFLDFRDQEWGRWRPSAQAKRLGPTAILLERLTSRDGHSVDEATEILRRNHRVLISDADLHEIWIALPRREPTLRVGEEQALEVAAPDVEIPDLLAAMPPQRKVGDVLKRAIATLSHRDQLIVVLRFGHAVTIDALAAHLALSRATIHRRIAGILTALRGVFEREGVPGSDVSAFLRSETAGSSEAFEVIDETVRRQVRLFQQDD